MDVQYLGLGDFLVVASAVLGVEPGVIAKVANLASADSALNAPAASFGGVEFYPLFPTKVAMLGYRLARNHPLPDGNKRSALLCMIEFAERNGWSLCTLDEEDVVEAMVDVASGAVSEQEFVRWVIDRLEQS